MKDQIMEMFAQGFVVVVSSYYRDETEESAEEIADVFEEAEDDEYVHVTVNIDEKAHQIELFVSCDE